MDCESSADEDIDKNMRRQYRHSDLNSLKTTKDVLEEIVSELQSHCVPSNSRTDCSEQSTMDPTKDIDAIFAQYVVPSDVLHNATGLLNVQNHSKRNDNILKCDNNNNNAIEGQKRDPKTYVEYKRKRLDVTDHNYSIKRMRQMDDELTEKFSDPIEEFEAVLKSTFKFLDDKERREKNINGKANKCRLDAQERTIIFKLLDELEEVAGKPDSQITLKEIENCLTPVPSTNDIRPVTNPPPVESAGLTLLVPTQPNRFISIEEVQRLIEEQPELSNKVAEIGSNLKGDPSKTQNLQFLTVEQLEFELELTDNLNNSCRIQEQNSVGEEKVLVVCNAVLNDTVTGRSPNANGSFFDNLNIFNVDPFDVPAPPFNDAITAALLEHIFPEHLLQMYSEIDEKENERTKPASSTQSQKTHHLQKAVQPQKAVKVQKAHKPQKLPQSSKVSKEVLSTILKTKRRCSQEYDMQKLNKGLKSSTVDSSDRTETDEDAYTDTGTDSSEDIGNSVNYGLLPHQTSVSTRYGQSSSQIYKHANCYKPPIDVKYKRSLTGWQNSERRSVALKTQCQKRARSLDYSTPSSSKRTEPVFLNRWNKVGNTNPTNQPKYRKENNKCTALVPRQCDKKNDIQHDEYERQLRKVNTKKTSSLSRERLETLKLLNNSKEKLKSKTFSQDGVKSEINPEERENVEPDVKFSFLNKLNIGSKKTTSSIQEIPKSKKQKLLEYVTKDKQATTSFQHHRTYSKQLITPKEEADQDLKIDLICKNEIITLKMSPKKTRNHMSIDEITESKDQILLTASETSDIENKIFSQVTDSEEKENVEPSLQILVQNPKDLTNKDQSYVENDKLDLGIKCKEENSKSEEKKVLRRRKPPKVKWYQMLPIDEHADYFPALKILEQLITEKLQLIKHFQLRTVNEMKYGKDGAHATANLIQNISSTQEDYKKHLESQEILSQQSVSFTPDFVDFCGVQVPAEVGKDQIPPQSQQGCDILRDMSLVNRDGALLISLPSEIKARNVLHKIAKVFKDVKKNIDGGVHPELKLHCYPKWEHVVFANNRLTLKPDTTAINYNYIKYSRESSRRRFEIIVRLLGKIVDLLVSNMTCTSRELYYQLMHLKCLANKRQIDCALTAVSNLLRIPPWEFGIFASGKGLAYGNLSLKFADGDTISFLQRGGAQIPYNIEDIRTITTSASFILIVEKDSIFQMLLAGDLMNKMANKSIIVTGKGYADVATRLFIRKLWQSARIPVFALVDCDPFGIEIMLTYRFGSLAQSHLSDHLALPELRWLGVHPSELVTMDARRIRMSTLDKSKLTSLLKRPYIDSVPKIRLELEILQASGLKAEIEGVMKGTQFLCDYYIPIKLSDRDYI